MTSQGQGAPQRSTEQAAFEYLTNVLTASWDGPLEIEILPRISLQPDSTDDPNFRIAVDGPCIGVPEQVLALAFVFARQCIFKVRNDSSLDALDSIAIILNATQVLLLHDPEHITAANIRKRFLRSLIDDRFNARDALDGAIRRELWMLDSFLSSPLNRHTKSPTLWNHRRWLLEDFMEWILDVQRLDILGSRRMTVLIGSIPDATEITWRSLIEPELRLICRAGERHPRNYYAWDYARKFMDVITEYCLMKDTDETRVVEMTVEFVQQWCMNHLTDTSGWSFLTHMMSNADEGVAARTFWHVGNMAIEYRFQEEPVWHFMRTLLASSENLSIAIRGPFIEQLQQWLDQQEAELKTAVASRSTPSSPRHTRSKSKAAEKEQMSLADQKGVKYLKVVRRHLQWIGRHWEGDPRPNALDNQDLEALENLTL